MRGIRLGGVAALLALALTATAANATDFCNGNGNVLDLAGFAYVTYDPNNCHCTMFPYDIWTYLETNGEKGLQRGGVTLLGDWDICQDSRTPDQGVF